MIKIKTRSTFYHVLLFDVTGLSRLIAKLGDQKAVERRSVPLYNTYLLCCDDLNRDIEFEYIL